MTPQPHDDKTRTDWRFDRRTGAWVSDRAGLSVAAGVRPAAPAPLLYLGDMHPEPEAEIRPWHEPAKRETSPLWALLMVGGAAMTGGMIGADMGAGA